MWKTVKQNPPTLLFGTVDKFAMLAWQEEAHNFFKANTNNGLPPDLIIQDELHLLNGPLGSITALYESTIELLCTKNGIYAIPVTLSWNPYSPYKLNVWLVNVVLKGANFPLSKNIFLADIIE